MDKTPFTIAAEKANASGWKAGAIRMTTEGKVVRKAIEAIIAAGFTCDLNDGEETTVKRSTSVNEVIQAAFTTDEDYLIARDATGKKVGTVYLVYGNDGHDVICDYSVSLEDVIAPVNEYADQLALA